MSERFAIVALAIVLVLFGSAGLIQSDRINALEQAVQRLEEAQ